MGSILKDESLMNAFKRFTLNERDIELEISSALNLSLYEHFYFNSIFTDDADGVNNCTHYVVNGFEVILPSNIKQKQLLKEQLGNYH